jgi:hypothetical protein
MVFMRRAFPIALLSLVCLAPPAAFAQGSTAIEGFGGMSLNSVTSRSPLPSLGGTVAVDVVPGVQIVGEVGRLGNVLPTLADSVFGVARTDLRASAFYGEGGVRLLAPTGAIAPYAEATAGIARIDVSSPRLGVIGNAATSIGLGLIGRTTPITSVGGGVLLRGGPMLFDVGYRYKRLFANDVLQAALGFGEPLRAHEVRAGVGVRF